jgi:hypothetical protein
MDLARLLRACVALSAVAAVAAPAALSASPPAVLRDYADNGKLDRTYSKADLEKALKSAVVRGYGHGKTQGLKPAVKTIAKPKATPTATPKTQKQGGVLASPPVKKSGGLPFTGLDLGLIALGAVLLLLFGAALRRFARQKA